MTTAKKLELLLNDLEATKQSIDNVLYDELQDYINNEIDRLLIYYSDIEEAVNEFSNIVEVLQGRYTMDNLYEDMHNKLYEDDDTLIDFINELSDDDIIKLYDNL
jgi:hypothetical protein